MRNEQLTQPEDQHNSKTRKVAAGLIMAASLTGVGLAAAHNDAPQKTERVTTQEDTKAFEAAIEQVAHPKTGDAPLVAHATITLKEGATVTDMQGNQTVLTKAIDGIQNPAWTPRANTLCFMPEKDQAVCFDKAADSSYMTVLITGTDGKPKVIAAEALTPDNAVQATVTTIEGDGFAYGHVDGSDEYIAGRPSMEGDTVPVPSLPTN